MIAGSLPPSVPASFSARMVEELKALGVETIVDTEGEPLVAALRAEPAAVTPNVARGGGRRRATSSTTARTCSSGCSSLVELGATEAVITRPEGCVASLLGPTRPAPRLRGDGARARAGRDRRLRRRLPGRLRCGRYDGRSPERMPALRRRLRRGVHPALRRRQHRSAARSSGCSPGSRSRELEAPRAVRLGLGAVYRCYPRRGVGEGPPNRRKHRISGPATRGFFVRERT